jgi:redox-regulated HSP33 family molecular chaperone
MPDMELSSYGLDRPESGDDVVVPFTLDALDCRGRVVHLGDALDGILTRHNYPAPVARLLGEAVVLAALIGSSLKFEGNINQNKKKVFIILFITKTTIIHQMLNKVKLKLISEKEIQQGKVNS